MKGKCDQHLAGLDIEYRPLDLVAALRFVLFRQFIDLLLFHWDDMNGLDDHLDFIARFQIKLLHGFRRDHGGHVRRLQAPELDQGHDVTLLYTYDPGLELVARTVFHRILLWFSQIKSVSSVIREFFVRPLHQLALVQARSNTLQCRTKQT